MRFLSSRIRTMVSSRMRCKGTRHDREMAAVFAVTVISHEGFYLLRSVLPPTPRKGVIAVISVERVT